MSYLNESQLRMHDKQKRANLYLLNYTIGRNSNTVRNIFKLTYVYVSDFSSIAEVNYSILKQQRN